VSDDYPLASVPRLYHLDLDFDAGTLDFLSFGGSGLHLAGFHATKLFHGSSKKVVSAVLSVAYGASSIVFVILQALNQYADFGLQDMSAGFCVIAAAVTINNFLVQPWKPYPPGISPPFPDARFYRKEWWNYDDKQKPLLKSVGGVLVKFDMWGETLFYSINLLLITYYLSTTAQLMYEKGDQPFTSNPNDWTDYMFTRMSGVFNGIGFIWFPIVQYFLQQHSWATCYLVMWFTSLALVGFTLIPGLEAQVIGFALQSMSRLMLFSFHHAYIIDKFGLEYFGTLNGLSSLAAAILGLSAYPLQLLGIYAGGAFALSFVPIGICVFLSFGFPFKLSRAKKLNWAETSHVSNTAIVAPKKLDDLVHKIVNNKKIRVVGSMHSCAPLIACEGIILDLSAFDKISIDAENRLVRVGAGVKIHNLCEALKPHGLAVGTLGTIDWQTVVGAVMTGTHGGALSIPSLHEFCQSYKLIKADREIVEVDREADKHLFSAMAPSIGVFGVVTEVTMRVVPMEYLEAKLFVIDFCDLSARFMGYMRENKYCRVVVYPSLNKATIWVANPVKKGEGVARGATEMAGYCNFRDEHEKTWLEESLWYMKNGQYEKSDAKMQQELDSQMKRLSHYEGVYNHVLCKERNNGIPHVDIEFNFAFDTSPDIIDVVYEHFAKNRMPYYNFEMRTTKRDDAMISCCQGRDAMWIDFQAKASDCEEFFATMESLLAHYGFRKLQYKDLVHMYEVVPWRWCRVQRLRG